MPQQSLRGLKIGMIASQVGHDEYVIDAPPHPRLVAQLAAWLADQGHPLLEVRAGAQRLEDVFRRLTADNARDDDHHDGGDDGGGDGGDGGEGGEG